MLRHQEGVMTIRKQLRTLRSIYPDIEFRAMPDAILFRESQDQASPRPWLLWSHREADAADGDAAARTD